MVSVETSNDCGSIWNVSATSFRGDISPHVTLKLIKHIVWDCKADLPGAIGGNYKIRVIADDGK